MINEGLKFSGTLKIEVLDPAGKLKNLLNLENLIVNSGLNFITSRMVGTDLNVMTHMGIGDGGAIIASAEQTNLQGLNKLRKAFTTATSFVNNVVSYVCQFNSVDNIAGGAITEAAIFNDGTDGNGQMLCRTVFPVVNKGPEDTMTITWNITVTAAT